MKNIKTTSKIISSPFSESITLIDLSMVVINFNRKNHYVNSLFYQKINLKGSNIYVDEFNSNRRVIVRKLYNEIINQLIFGGLRESRISYNLSRFFQFIRWCDSEKIHNCLDNDITCIDAIKSYTNYCWEQVSLGKNKVTTITTKLSMLIHLLKKITNEEFHHLFPSVKTSNIDRELTFPPDDIHARENIQILHSIINGAHDLIANKKKYPYAWKIPEFLNIHENTIWIFPIRSWCQTSFNDNGTRNKQRVNLGFNYKYGRIVTHKELWEVGVTDPKCQMGTIRHATLVLKKANKHDIHVNSLQKKDFLIYAIASFTFLLIANTGMNPTQLLNIKWGGKYIIEKENIDFYSIKFRAFNKKVYFRITSKFLPLFKIYLELRSYYLQGKQSDYLIPSFGDKYDSHKDLVDISGKIRFLMKHLGYKNGLIVARQWRCLKAEWLINNADPSIAAKLLQNTEETILNHYSSGTFTKQTEDLTNFLTKLSDVSMITDTPYKISTSVGGCNEPDKPINISSKNIFNSDCQQPEGCLFCSNFLIHADESDLLKILSCKYCIEHTQTLSRSYDDWHNIYTPVLLRIDEIVNSIAEINYHLVDKMKHEVYTEGNLDPYWAGKLEMLISIGAITNEK